VLLWPAGQVPAAVSGVASVPVPTPEHGTAPQVTVVVSVVSEAGQTAPAWSAVTSWMVATVGVAGQV
jgi:hypothetical protein